MLRPNARFPPPYPPPPPSLTLPRKRGRVGWGKGEGREGGLDQFRPDPTSWAPPFHSSVMIRNWSGRKSPSPLLPSSQPEPSFPQAGRVKAAHAGRKGRVFDGRPAAWQQRAVAITHSLADSYCCQNSASPRSRGIAINTSLPHGPLRCEFGFLSPPAPRPCLGRTRVVPIADDLPSLPEPHPASRMQ